MTKKTKTKQQPSIENNNNSTDIFKIKIFVLEYVIGKNEERT